jgi:peptidoglycan/xylan/chitin deacetylase (PgdA/CDA1 family)
MTLLFDKDRPIKSPALAPAQGAFERAGAAELTIALVNNMPDSALKATERQFMRLVQAAAGDIRVNFHCFSLPTVARSKQASEHIAHDYADIADLDRVGIDGLIVTGAKARASNRLARHLFAAPMQLGPNQPMVSFTFDDIPLSAATVGAPMLEEFGGRGTFYVAGGLVGQPNNHCQGIDPTGIVKLRRSGHEIACHTFSHRRAIELDAAAMAAEIAQNRRFLEGLDASIKLENFAYPYGFATVARKRQLTHNFRSARGILPGVNSGTIDLQLLRSTPLIDKDIDRAGIDRAFDEAVATSGWLIFYTHDVADTPSPWGCTPGLLRHALDAAKRRNMPMVSVAEALRRAAA